MKMYSGGVFGASSVRSDAVHHVRLKCCRVLLFFVVCLNMKINAKGWGLGQANGKVGWFPGDFVEMKPAPSASASADRKNRCDAGQVLAYQYTDGYQCTGGCQCSGGDLLGDTGVLPDEAGVVRGDTTGSGVRGDAGGVREDTAAVLEGAATVLAGAGVLDYTDVLDDTAVLGYSDVLDDTGVVLDDTAAVRECTAVLSDPDAPDDRAALLDENGVLGGAAAPDYTFVMGFSAVLDDIGVLDDPADMRDGADVLDGAAVRDDPDVLDGYAPGRDGAAVPDYAAVLDHTAGWCCWSVFLRFLFFSTCV